MNQGEVATADTFGKDKNNFVSIPYESGRSGHTVAELQENGKLRINPL